MMPNQSRKKLLNQLLRTQSLLLKSQFKNLHQLRKRRRKNLFQKSPSQKNLLLLLKNQRLMSQRKKRSQLRISQLRSQ
jgi:hypothetical protein